MPNDAVLVLKRKDDRNGNPKSFDVLRADGFVGQALEGLPADNYHVFGAGKVVEYKVEYVQQNTPIG